MHKITHEIAEICGIVAGDGHLSRYISSKRTDYRVEIVGDKKEEIKYSRYISSLFNGIFNKPLKFRAEKDCFRLYIHSRSILEFFEDIGLIVGKKSDKIYIPKEILNDHELSLSFLRGLADTDFSMNFKKGGRKNNSYPKIVGEFASEKIIKDIMVVLDRAGITYYNQRKINKNSFGTFVHHRIEINGKKNFMRWMGSIGFSNPKHITKIQVWEKLGYCPPRTTYHERIKMLKEG